MVKKTPLVLLAIVVCLFLSSPSYLLASDGLYFFGSFNARLLEDSSLTQSGVTIDAEFDQGYGLSLGIGQKTGSFRYDIEFNYSINDIDKLTSGGGSASGGGDFTATSLLLNGYYEIKTGTAASPYFGAGIGLTQISINDASVLGITFADDKDLVFSYQVGGGLDFYLQDNFVVGLGYKYFATLDPEFTDIAGFPFDAEYKSHNLTLGIKYYFQ